MRTCSVALGLGAALLACGPGGGGAADAAPDSRPAPARCPIGDFEGPPELVIGHLDTDSVFTDTTPMQAVPLQTPPQGGLAVLIGVRATNIDGCLLTLTTALHDVVDGQILTLETRPARLEDTGDGWGVSTLGTISNLQVCPQLTATRDLHGEPYEVSVLIEDVDGRSASGSVTIVPTCPEELEFCPCLCDRDYTVGAPCEPGALLRPGAAPPGPSPHSARTSL